MFLILVEPWWSQITSVSSCPHSNTSLGWEQRNVAGKVKELFELIAAFQILMVFIQFLCEAKKKLTST